MRPVRIVIFGDGTDELGELEREYRDSDDLPALPRLVHRLLKSPSDAVYVTHLFREIRGAHGKGSKFYKKTKEAIRWANNQKYDAAVIVVDRDCESTSTRSIPIKQARDEMAVTGFIPCGVGMAVEAFDAWMIVDGSAIGRLDGGKPDSTHPAPENLCGKRGSGNHPKDWAKEIMGGGENLWRKYAIAAAFLDLALLKKCCSEGFAPFADEVEKKLGPVVV